MSTTLPGTVNVLCVGDSRTRGVGTTGAKYPDGSLVLYKTWSWCTRAYLHAQAEGRWWFFENRGRSGTTPWDGLDTLPEDLNCYGDPTMWDAAVLWYGINAARKDDPMPGVVWQSQLDQMINRLLYGGRDGGGYVKYVFLPLNPLVERMEADWFPSKHSDSYIEDYNRRIRDSAAQDIHKDKVFVIPDVVEAWNPKERGWLFGDGLHPHYGGQDWIGRRIYVAMRAVLG